MHVHVCICMCNRVRYRPRASSRKTSQINNSDSQYNYSMILQPLSGAMATPPPGSGTS